MKRMSIFIPAIFRSYILTIFVPFFQCGGIKSMNSKDNRIHVPLADAGRVALSPAVHKCAVLLEIAGMKKDYA